MFIVPLILGTYALYLLMQGTGKAAQEYEGYDSTPSMSRSPLDSTWHPTRSVASTGDEIDTSETDGTTISKSEHDIALEAAEKWVRDAFLHKMAYDTEDVPVPAGVDPRIATSKFAEKVYAAGHIEYLKRNPPSIEPPPPPPRHHKEHISGHLGLGATGRDVNNEGYSDEPGQVVNNPRSSSERPARNTGKKP